MMMNHSVSEKPQNKPLFLPSNGFWEFQDYNYKGEIPVQHTRRRERMSLDEILLRHERPMKLEEINKKKQKQQSSSSSSSSGRFVSLLNTFFSQLWLKKKRSMNSSWKDGEESGCYPGNRNGTRRRRRNSMSQFLSWRVADDPRSSFDDHKQVMALSRDKDEHVKSIVSKEEMDFVNDAKFEFPKQRLGNPDLVGNRRRTWQDEEHCHQCKKMDEEKVKREEEEDYDSDSSSDLFELKNF